MVYLEGIRELKSKDPSFGTSKVVLKKLISISFGKRPRPQLFSGYDQRVLPVLHKYNQVPWIGVLILPVSQNRRRIHANHLDLAARLLHLPA
jgi:hypothetical protein